MKNNIVPFQRSFEKVDQELHMYKWLLLDLIEETEEEINRLNDEISSLDLEGEKLAGWLTSLQAAQERLLGYVAELKFLEQDDWEE